MQRSSSRSAARPPGTRASPGRRAAWTALDVVLILVFAISGRRTHEHGLTVQGVLETAWPFLAAYAGAALVLWSRRPTGVPSAVVLWLTTVAGGMALRALAGAGVAFSFQVVTLLVLGVFLLLPRLVARALGRRRRTVA